MSDSWKKMSHASTIKGDWSSSGNTSVDQSKNMTRYKKSHFIILKGSNYQEDYNFKCLRT